MATSECGLRDPVRCGGRDAPRTAGKMPALLSAASRHFPTHCPLSSGRDGACPVSDAASRVSTRAFPWSQPVAFRLVERTRA
jgi:hypothetical protein